jgi:hypothetical protein
MKTLNTIYLYKILKEKISRQMTPIYLKDCKINK